MRHVIVGTAGHIDHGKTALVRALTGIDTDTLPEEKARGVTIDIGFAYWKDHVTFIDVPGHERFVKNMVTGVCSVDLAILVVAADDGPMPQTREHLGILNLLRVERGIIAITKTDLVEEDWVELVAEELRELVSETFLAEAPIVQVSNETGEGIDTLRTLVEEEVAKVGERADSGIFRLPVDRAFSVRGFGTVVTGTVVSGSVKDGSTVDLLPNGQPVRVRGLQTHGRDVGEAVAGARVAMNIAGVDVGDVTRGDLLVQPGHFETTYMIDARLQVLNDASAVKNRARVHLHLGPRGVLARVIVLEGDEIAPGESALVQFRLETPGVAARGDRFVIRRFSPVVTLGGGVVLDAKPPKHRRLRSDVIAAVEQLEADDPEQVLLHYLTRDPYKISWTSDLAAELGVSVDIVSDLLNALVAAGAALCVPGTDGGYVSKDRWGVLCDEVVGLVERHHASYPLQSGMSQEALRQVLDLYDSDYLQRVIGAVVADGGLVKEGPALRTATHTVTFGPEEETARESILEALREAGASPPDFDALEAAAGLSEVGPILDAMATRGDLVRLEDTMWFAAEVIADIREKLIRFAKDSGEIGVSDFRDLVGTSRKFAVPLLNFFDAEGITERKGDVRVLL